MNDILRLLDMLPDADRTRAERLARLGEYRGTIGWGYSDFLADVATRLHLAGVVVEISGTTQSYTTHETTRRIGQPDASCLAAPVRARDRPSSHTSLAAFVVRDVR